MGSRPARPRSYRAASQSLGSVELVALLSRTDLRWLGVANPRTHERTETPAKGQIVSVRLTGATGLEPATSGVTGRRSNQLSYAPMRGTVSMPSLLGRRVRAGP
jgi:hypothetical protein